MKTVSTPLLVLLGACVLAFPIHDKPGSGPSGPSGPSSASGADVASTLCPLASDDPKGPVLFFSDLESGPNRGGENDLGVFITLYGLRFGATPGRVTIGGVEVARYVAWNPAPVGARGLERIIIQPGAGVSSGDVLVTVDGRTSNALRFNVRAGRVYLIDLSAGSEGDGSFSSPFQHLYSARAKMTAGDTVFIQGSGTTEVDPEVSGHPSGMDANLYLRSASSTSGTADAPIAYVAYPGAEPTIGGSAAADVDVALWMDDDLAGHFTFAGLHLVHAHLAISLARAGVRVIGNNISDINTGNNGVILTTQANNQKLALLGNTFSRFVNAAMWIYGPTDGLEIGWNEARDGKYLFGGFARGLDNLTLHDNVVTDTEYPVSLVETYLRVQIYNNVFNGATGAHVLIGAVTSDGGPFVVQNNTFTAGTSFSVAAEVRPLVSAQNNILSAGAAYASGDPDAFTAADHNFYDTRGGSPPPIAVEAAPLVGNPRYASPGAFTLASDSPAIDKGVALAHCADHFGVVRPQGAGVDIGAVEHTSAP